MSTIIDYVKWRGDISYLDEPYNEKDYLVFSALAYVHLDDLVDFDINKTATIKETYDLYIKRNESFLNEELVKIQNESHYLFELVAASPRYQNIHILNYVNDIDKTLVKQFAAISFLLEDQTLFVSYRGTDDSLIGWHEDYLMLCESVVPSQTSSVGYVEYVSQYRYHLSLKEALKQKQHGSLFKRIYTHFYYKRNGLPLILGGHSKGGNLAMYAGCYCKSDVNQRIKHVYNFDGPGFQDDIMISSNYQRMLPRMISYIPHYSFFGIVLGHQEKYEVVHSYNKGMLQHNLFSWEVDLNGFVSDELSYDSVQFAIKVILFLEKLTKEEKKDFVEAMFGLFDSLQLYYFSDLTHISYKHILAAIKELTLLDNNVSKMLIEVLHMLWLEAKKTK